MKREVEEALANSREALAHSQEALEKTRAALAVQVALPLMPGKRFKLSGRNMSGSSPDRHTVKVEIRMSPELAADARTYCAENNIFLAELVAAGLEAKRAAKP